MKSLWLYILLLSSSWPSICRLRRSPLECLSHPALHSTCCELQWIAWHYLGVIPSLMRSDYQLQAFNAEVIGSSTIALSPCSHSCPPMIVPSFGDDEEGCSGWRIALSSQDTSLSRTWHFSAIYPSSFGPSLAIHRRFLLGWALGLIIRNGPRHPDLLAPQLACGVKTKKESLTLVWLFSLGPPPAPPQKKKKKKKETKFNKHPYSKIKTFPKP